ncbi:MAG: hypothetical protein ACXVBX_12285 [Flavisolibacter sp.]
MQKNELFIIMELMNDDLKEIAGLITKPSSEGLIEINKDYSI